MPVPMPSMALGVVLMCLLAASASSRSLSAIPSVNPPSASSFPMAPPIMTSNNIAIAITGGFGRVGDAIDCLASGPQGSNACQGATDQVAVAWYMDQVCGLVNCTAIASGGDNFYPAGVSFNTSIGQPGRLLYWEDVYHSNLVSNIQDLSWIITTGNHDYQGNYAAERDFPAIDDRWIMPSNFFVQDIFSADGTSLRVIQIDTVILITNLTLLADDYFPGFENISTAAARAAQEAFLEHALSTSNATWNIIQAHHPFYSATSSSYALLDPGFNATLEIINKYQVPVVIGPHDHSLSISHVGNTSYVESGTGALCEAGDGCNPEGADDANEIDMCPSYIDWVAQSNSSCNKGIVTVTATQSTLTVEMWSFAQIQMPIYMPAYTRTYHKSGGFSDMENNVTVYH